MTPQGARIVIKNALTLKIFRKGGAKPLAGEFSEDDAEKKTEEGAA